MKNLSIIVAVSRNNAIGKKGKLLCHLTADMKRFKELTTGHTVIMGRRTFESLPKGALPNRRNIVVTRNPNFSAANIETAYSIEDAFRMVENDGEAFVIGGEQIYRETLPFASRLYLTRIEATFLGADAFFPEINLKEWTETAREHHESDDKNDHAFTFIDYRR